MKKNISINLQGMIFHIEEDGYDVLSRYLAEVKAHFSGYRGHEEIVADIESRIAELFAARLSGLKQVITLEDVEAMTAKMGRVRDFQTADEAEDDEEILATAVANGSAQGTYTGARTSSAYSAGAPTSGPTPTAEAEAEAGSKRLYRDMTNRKIAGVAAGIARYFAVNPVWVRLGFLVLLFMKPLIRGIIDLDDHNFRFEGFNLGSLAIISYVVLWIALPKRYDTPPSDEDAVFKKLYRDTDTGKVGGVSAGLAAYFKVDVVLIRILFIIGFFAGGFAIPLYIILWILLPEAKTASDKLRMRGDAVTLSALDNNLRSNALNEEGVPANNRPVGMFLENFFQNIRPLINLLGSAIRVFVGAMLILLGFSLLLTCAILLGVGLGLIPASDNLDLGPMQPYILFNEVSPWAILSFFLLTAIPALALLLSGIGLLLRRTVLHRTASLTLLGLWLLGIVGSSIAGTRLAREFQREGEITQTVNLPTLTSPRLVLERRQQNSGEWLDLDLVVVDSTQTPRLERIISARGVSEEAARRTASTSVVHGVRTPNDSTLSIDDHFTFQPNARYRDQEVQVRLLLPRNRTFRMSETFADWLSDEDYVDGRPPYHAEKFAYRLRGSKIECIGCTEADLRGGSNDESDEGDSRNSDDYEAGRADSDINLNFGTMEAFSTDENSYGQGRQRYEESDFDHVSVVGPYRVVVRQGSEYRVQAAGPGRALRDLRVERDGEELTIRPRNRDLFDSRSTGKPILITIETPELNDLELVGGTRAQVSGFNSGSLRVQQAGGTQLQFRGDLDELRLELAGGCRAALQGSANQLRIEGTGACEVAAADLTARRADVDAVAGCKVRLRVTEELQADAVGASEIEYSGQPKTVRRDAVGAAVVRAVD